MLAISYRGSLATNVVTHFPQDTRHLTIEGITHAEASRYWTNRGVAISGTRGTVTTATYRSATGVAGDHSENQPRGLGGRQSRATLPASSAASAGLTPDAARTRIAGMLGETLTRLLIDSGRVKLVTSSAEIPGGKTSASTTIQGATLRDGTIYLNLAALDEANFDGVFLHEGFHAAVRGWVGEDAWQQDVWPGLRTTQKKRRQAREVCELMSNTYNLPPLTKRRQVSEVRELMSGTYNLPSLT